MLGKLIKHEFKATGRIFLPLFGALIAVCALSRVLLSMQLNIPAQIGVFLSVLMIFCVAIGVVALTIQRFNRNLIGSEGYLTHTLPVSVDSLIWSKLIAAMVWFVAGIITVIVAILILIESSFGINDLVRELSNSFRHFMQFASFW